MQVKFLTEIQTVSPSISDRKQPSACMSMGS